MRKIKRGKCYSNDTFVHSIDRGERGPGRYLTHLSLLTENGGPEILGVTCVHGHLSGAPLTLLGGSRKTKNMGLHPLAHVHITSVCSAGNTNVFPSSVC